MTVIKYSGQSFAVRCIVALAGLLVFLTVSRSLFAQAGIWATPGPDGGDARAFAAVPGDADHLYLGGTDSWVYESLDSGRNWRRLSRIGDETTGENQSFIVDNLIVDSANPQRLYAGVWRVDQPDGGLFVSKDGGRSWRQVPGLKGQSIRSLVQSASDPRTLVAGTLEGVFRSMDGGADWQQISPPGSREIHEVESLAVDPKDADVIYAGTWHLPWKTSNGGKTWHSIKHGVIDDSDVFSIILDPIHPQTVYASACSGIYKSENGGELFHKVQGIPSTARRTRVLVQDTHNRAVVYAGTTEGLYRTRDAGRVWQPLTGPDVIINDIYLDPAHPGRILLATDRGGVLASEDGGATFASSNAGFSARKVGALLVAEHSAGEILAGIVNDKSYGGVFASEDGGAHWRQSAQGLDGRDVFALAEAKDGTILAGTSHGIFLRTAAETSGSAEWKMQSTIVNHGTRIVTISVNGRPVNRLEPITLPARELSAHVSALDLSTESWLAASEEGLFTSTDHGSTWQGGMGLGAEAYESVAVGAGWMVAARRNGAIYSRDQGLTWDAMPLPSRIKNIHAILFTPQGDLWVGAGDGIYVSRDKGKGWFWLDKVPVLYLDDLSLDATSGRVLAGSRRDQRVFLIDPQTFGYTTMQTGFPLYRVRSAHGQLLAATLQDGVITHRAP